MERSPRLSFVFACKSAVLIAAGTVAMGLVGLNGHAVAQTNAPAPAAEELPPRSPEPVEVQPIESESAQAESIEAQIPTCPPGQFPSAFSDVLPTHWAYQAVLNLAAPPIRCFDLPSS